MADYSHYAVPATEWVEYAKSLENSQVFPRAGASTLEIRDSINEERADKHRKFYGTPEDVVVDAIEVPTPDGSSIPARLYRPKTAVSSVPSTSSPDLLPLYIHLHGGGWHLGSLDTDEPLCMYLCSRFSSTISGLAILNVNYRHTPEHTFPTQPQDAWAAFELFASPDSGLAAKYGIDSSRIVIGGISAGSSLSVATALTEMRRVQKLSGESVSPTNSLYRIRGLILMSPPTVHPDLFPFELLKNREVSSFAQHETAVILATPRAKYYYDMYIMPDDEASKADERVSPLLVPDEMWDKTLWPSTSLHVSGVDALRDEGLLFAEKLKRIGVMETKVKVYSGYPHAFNLLPELKETRVMEDGIIDDLKRFLMS